MKKILIVCKGNIYRSPVAKIFLDREIKKRGLESKISTDSAGIQGSAGIPTPKFPNFSFYKEEFKTASPIIEKFNLDFSGLKTKPIDNNLISQADIIIAVDKKVIENKQGGILTQFPDAANKIYFLSELTGSKKEIEDPDGVTITEKYATITEEIHKHITEGFDNLLKILKLN